MDIEIGSNLYTNTDGTIEIEGIPQLQISIHPSSKALMVNFALFDEGGRMVAKVVDSSMWYNERRLYELSKSQTGLVLKHSESGKVVLQLDLKHSADHVSFNQGEFRTIKGHVLQVSPTVLQLDKQRTSGSNTDTHGGAVVIG